MEYEPLTPEEILKMRGEVNARNGITAPPGREYWDIGRIVTTLEQMQAEIAETKSLCNTAVREHLKAERLLIQAEGVAREANDRAAEMELSETPDYFDAFQEGVGKWASETFPRSDRDTIAAHLMEETKEFIHANWTRSANADEEAADCVLLLLHYCYRRNVSLMELMEKKMVVNRARTWADDGRGYMKHVEETEESKP